MNFHITSTYIYIIHQFIYNYNNKSINTVGEIKFSNSGFTLIYDHKLLKEKKISKKIDNRSLLIFHKTLKKKSFVKITNPVNQKTVIPATILVIASSN